MSVYANWQHLERAMRAGVVCDALPARARVWMAVQLMEAEGVEAIGPSAIAKRCGLPLRTTNNHLRTLRAESVLKSNGGNYGSAESRHAESWHDESAENRHSVPKTGTVNGVPKTGTMAVPKTGTLSIYKRSRSTTTAVAGESPESRAVSWPTFGNNSNSPDGLGDVLKAWESLTNVSQLKPDTIASLRISTTELGAALMLEVFDDIRAYVADSSYHGTPRLHWIRQRATKIKADRSRPSKARKARGGGDEMIGTTTPEQRAKAGALASPEAIAEWQAQRAAQHDRIAQGIADRKKRGEL